MDSTDALRSIIQTLPALPAESLESTLVAVDSLVGVSDALCRPAAAAMLRETAAQCPETACRERLLQAAEALSAGQPCALTPEGLSWKQAAAAQTVSLEEWGKRVAAEPLPRPPEEPEAASDEDETEEDTPRMEEAPPPLPELPVRHFFGGLTVRVAQDFRDAGGRAVCAGDVLRLLSGILTDDGENCVLSFLDRTIRLHRTVPGHHAIMENAANAWWQPVPTMDCLEGLWEAIDARLSTADEDEELNDADLECLDGIAEDVETCEDWLLSAGDRGPAPRCGSAPLAAKFFGRDHEMTVWIRLLFSAVAVAMPNLPDC